MLTVAMTAKEAAAMAGIDKSVISQWKRGQSPDPRRVVTFARAFGRPPVEALVAAGILNEDEAHHSIEVRRPLSELTNDMLMKELNLRLAALSPQESGHHWGRWSITEQSLPGESHNGRDVKQLGAR